MTDELRTSETEAKLAPLVAQAGGRTQLLALGRDIARADGLEVPRWVWHVVADPVLVGRIRAVLAQGDRGEDS